MKRIFQSAVLFFGSLIPVSFLPLYVEQTMTRRQTPRGDAIDYGWKIRTLYGYVSDYNYFRPEENFAFYLAVNILLACVYAFIISGGTFLLMSFVKNRKTRSNF